MFGFKKKEKTIEELEREKYKKDITKAKREAYWTSRKESEVRMARERGSSYKPLGKSISEGAGAFARGLTAKGGFLDIGIGSSKGRKSSGFGIGEPSSEYAGWLGGSSIRLTRRRHKKQHRPRRRVHKKGHRRVKIIEYY